MRLLLLHFLSLLENIYGGWILWNLFLAFIPLVLSYLLFRRQSVARPWLWWFCGVVGFIGAVGLWAKVPDLLSDRLNFLRSAIKGDVSAIIGVSWWGVLGLIALGLSIWIFKRRSNARSFLWWLGLIVFISFLPNAAYVLTDIIHLIRAIGSGFFSVWTLTLVVIPIHFVAIFLGFEAYVISILNQGSYLREQGSQQYILPAELLMHSLSAVGIYLGRFIRFNSWDLVTDPANVLLTTLNTLTEKRPVAVIIVTVVILTTLYWILKQITLGLTLRVKDLQSSEF
ncbi:DUF1361 domain-containing protein [Lyngbya confervoides]|uniref:DUF1361 domain-containing protein n=1 Tax=Lyngbya confervoides BDU141951 TaxID=1574623 RepID=A0ABD4SZG7_9CYAN|nr:DUF1361 domain-containing protein [Lyngbya confervoides]MCM1981740.1 DUF1361 domain-containing protein [Lyngbya confervoides BDU141951]